MEFKPNLEESIQRMKGLWNLDLPLDREPTSVHLPSPPGRIADGSFFGRLDDYIRFQEMALGQQAQVHDDRFPVVFPQYGHALIAALCGSPIRGESETVWAVPTIDDIGAAADTLHLDWDNEWGARYREDLARLLNWAEKRCAVAIYEVEGVSDTLSALRGPQPLMYDLHDSPEAIDRLAKRITDLLIEFVHWNQREVGSQQNWYEGIVTDWALWMPSGSICFAEDAKVMMSPELYRTAIMKWDRYLTKAFNRTHLEVHTEGNHQIENFGAVEGVSCMAIQNPLRMRPEHREIIRTLLGKKVFYISVGSDQIEELLSFTGTRGIYLSTSAGTAREAHAVLEMIERLTQRYC